MSGPLMYVVKCCNSVVFVKKDAIAEYVMKTELELACNDEFLLQRLIRCFFKQFARFYF